MDERKRRNFIEGIFFPPFFELENITEKPRYLEHFQSPILRTNSTRSPKRRGKGDMVQFIFTPWRDRQELLTVRGQFFPAAPDLCGGHVPKSPGAPEPGSGEDQNVAVFGDQTHNRQELRHSAVARVSMWVQRGNCPHLVESTALLVAAILSDEGFQEDRDQQGSSAFAVRAAYSTAFSRYGTPHLPFCFPSPPFYLTYPSLFPSLFGSLQTVLRSFTPTISYALTKGED